MAPTTVGDPAEPVSAYGVGPGELFGEARYHYVGLEFLSTGEANAGGVGIAAGYRLGF